MTLKTDTIVPSPYERATVSDLDAVTMYSPEGGYQTVNVPRAVFFPAAGGVTVQATPGTGQATVKSKSRDAFVHSVIYRGMVFTTGEFGLLKDLEEILNRL